ncbi:hypothetical protein [Aminobacter aminovorans]|uniref:Uncharacterized protein n=1 Tax=Aminobacter aminovorans TaxID=83263 RepID=A0AAC9FDF4_AMIAI|nr:hypothetical protein [Aminobacter aminovorans]AMS41162.1 hypothetical protein AA2016_2233 [Aminobacter aminovorans]MBB3705856.1 hypothetical protein [Aminobacter aminovorans]
MSNRDDTPEGMIARLDASLARRGEDVKLRRLTLGPNAVQIPFDADVRASIRPMRPEELVGHIDQTWSRVILSPTDVNRAQWPLPIRKGDKIVQGSTPRNVEFVKAITVQNTLVRIELTVGG